MPAILVFSKTREWRHEDGITGGDMHMLKLSRVLNYGIFTTENAAVFNPDDLARFKLVVFNNFTGDGLSPDQKAAFKAWTEAGGGILALHGSGDNSHGDWLWYAQTIIGPTFISHPMDPQFQEARVETLAQDHPVAKGLPKNWSAVEEWYTFDSVPDENFTVIAGIDESTYSPVNNVYGDVSDLRMGEGAENHPIIWARCIGEGRSVYSAIGHLETAYDNPPYQVLIENAARWVLKETDPENAGCK
jgi:type 1 glutamine amidotransferase